MYDVKFGDCFQLTGNLFPEGLVVDFGSMYNLGRRFDDIITDFHYTKPDKLLLSHYHIDHLSGLLYMMASGYYYQFNEILIPDIFSTRGLNRAIVLLYLEEFLNSCILPQRGRGRRYTLLEFVTYLCVHPMKITLLKRGDKFHSSIDTCTVLWPDEKYIVNYADAVLRQFDISNDALQELINASESLANIVLSLTTARENTIGGSYQEILLTIRRQLDGVFEEYNFLDQLLNHKIELKKFAHSINLVFHNSIDGNRENFLFTGDIETGAMKQIEANPSKIPELNLHKQYEYIKIPHHGTSNHFYDYTSHSPTNILISNGRCRKSSYMITNDYFNLYSINSKIYCSNCNWCKQRAIPPLVCDCTNRSIIWPDIKKYIP